MRRAPAVMLALALAASGATASRAAEGVPALDRIIVVVMENHDYDVVRVLPYTASLIAASSSFSSSFAVTHPSQPNYLALWGASTMGVTNDACPPAGSPYTSENLGHACEAAGIPWRAYSEALRAAGSAVCSAGGGLYTRKHEPWTDWSNLSHANEQPFTQFALDTAAHALPRLAFVIPDNCHNTHDCTPATGDTWLAATIPGLIEAAGPNGVVILTWDEDDFVGDNHILTVFAGPRVRSGYVSTRPLSHYSVVRTITAAFGLAAFANAATDSAVTDVWLPIADAVAPAAAPALPRAWLGAPAPSPTRGEVHTTLHLPAPAHIEAAIHDAAGRRVRMLDAAWRAGDIPLAWDGRDDAGRDAGPGVFYLRVRAAGQTMARAVVRVR